MPKMDDVRDIVWDVVISGTGLQQSLLALALSRSDKKVLHVDRNEYYGGSEAAFSLQEVEEWIKKVNSGAHTSFFSNASFAKVATDDGVTSESEKLSFSRAYAIALSPQIIYSRSKLLSQLVSSKIYRQLEFQAVGNWWILDGSTLGDSNGLENKSTCGLLKRIPNGREDVFSDGSIDVRAKRSLMKFLKFVVDYENQGELWQPHAETSLPEFLSASFNLPPVLQTVILALTLSLDRPAETTVRYSLPRIARHLTSVGIFGPGFGAVIPKWGGASEITQVACRAGAVGGAVYMLGTGVGKSQTTTDHLIALTLTNDEALKTLTSDGTVRSKTYVNASDHGPDSRDPGAIKVSKMIAIVSTDFSPLFASTVEGGPTAAVSVISLPSNSMTSDGQNQPEPIYIMAHSSDTGECPMGQCVLYATIKSTSNAKARLEAAVSNLLNYNHAAEPSKESPDSVETQPQGRVLYSVYYEQMSAPSINSYNGDTYVIAPSSVDLAFDDATLDNVEMAWRMVIRRTAGDEVSQGDIPGSYMQFEDRGGGGGEEDD